MKKSTKITNQSIESAGLPKDPKHAIAEYLWNGFDAKATQIELSIDSNELGYINRVSIQDNGEGIPLETLSSSFGNFLDSIKKIVSNGAPIPEEKRERVDFLSRFLQHVRFGIPFFRRMNISQATEFKLIAKVKSNTISVKAGW